MPASTNDKVAAAERRRTNKPIMEKKRRQRINDSLNQLKDLVLEGLKKDPSRYNKLEKADILEMTVRHVQSLHRHQQTTTTSLHRSPSADPIAKFCAGFGQCAAEVGKFLEGDKTLSSIQRSRILLHLADVMAELRTTENNNNNNNNNNSKTTTTTTTSDTYHHHQQQQQQYIAAQHQQQQLSPIQPRPEHHYHPQQQPSPSPSPPHQHNHQSGYDPLVVHGVSLVPARLLTGQMALVLPHGVTGTLTSPGDLHAHHVPPSPPPSAASPSLSLSSSPPPSPCRSPSPQPLDLAPIRHPEDDNCWRPW